MKKVLGAPNTDKLLVLMHKNFQFLVTTTTTATATTTTAAKATTITTAQAFSDSQKVKFY